jgi:transcriptional regulator with XRE-family HTH domain
MSQQTTAAAKVPEWDLADRMRKSLRVSGVGVQEMADYLDVARNTVSTWINGKIVPSTQTQRLWALRCGVSYEWLHSGSTSEVESLTADRELRRNSPSTREDGMSESCCTAPHADGTGRGRECSMTSSERLIVRSAVAA